MSSIVWLCQGTYLRYCDCIKRTLIAFKGFQSLRAISRQRFHTKNLTCTHMFLRMLYANQLSNRAWIVQFRSFKCHVWYPSQQRVLSKFTLKFTLWPLFLKMTFDLYKSNDDIQFYMGHPRVKYEIPQSLLLGRPRELRSFHTLFKWPTMIFYVHHILRLRYINNLFVLSVGYKHTKCKKCQWFFFEILCIYTKLYTAINTNL